jgi:tRNA G18 (ribose-2'-O)-methylase SpoU
MDVDVDLSSSTMPAIPVSDPSDPRLADYRDLKDNRLNQDTGKLIAESEGVVRMLLASPLTTVSVLLSPTRHESLAATLASHPDLPVYVAPQPILDAITGFHVHRGCLALALRPRSPVLPADTRRLLVLEDLVDVDNLGSLIRSGAALGADGVLLSPQCADPYYRKAIRTSTGHVFTLPIVRAQRWPAALDALRSTHQVVGLTLSPRAIPLTQWQPRERVALVLGTEGTGLSEAAVAACDLEVTIPMHRADSLNVAVAGAIVLHHLGAHLAV